MGEFSKTYRLPPGITQEESDAWVKRAINSDAIDSGYTPDSDPVWNAQGGKAYASVSVVEESP